jgi:NTE family protein
MMTKALVLSGGGSVGIAWQTGLAAGLRRREVDLTEAAFILGTSAGSAVGAQLALGRDPEEQVERYAQSEPSRDTPANAGPGGPMAELMTRFMEFMVETADLEPEERRARIGRFALEADALDEEQFVGMFRYLKGEPWPERYACTAVDAESGEFKVWDTAAGVELDRAVASSCAVPGLFSPITINGRRYMDGGMRSGTSADLAVGHDVVLVVSLMTASRMPTGDPRLARLFQAIESEQAVLIGAGARVETVTPDQSTSAVIGMNLMDGSLAPAAAVEGVRQGEELAEQVGEYWR